jgi:tRNA (guanine9-N1)-methyltransferase
VTAEESERLNTIKARNMNKKKAKANSREAVEKAMSSDDSVKVILDLDFEHLMEERDLRSLVSQMNFCYGANMQATDPVHLIFSGMKPDRFIYKHFHTKVDGFSSWLVTCKEETFSEAFPKEKLVYLTADASDEDVLETLEPGKYYIIGALVDHNQHKGLTFDKATELGIATKKLAIPQELIGASRRVLAVNHVFEILVNYQNLKDWRKACEVAIPARKIVSGDHSPAAKRRKKDPQDEEEQQHKSS